MKRILLITALSVAFFQNIKAESYELTLEQSIGIAKERSYSMLRLAQDLKIAEYNLKSATSSFKTHIDLALTLPDYSETVRQWEDSTGITFYPVKQLGSSANLTINQPLPTDGNIYVESILSSIDDYRFDTRSANVNTRIRLRQPLDAFYGYNSIRSSYERARLNYERTQKSLKRAELALIYQVSSAYYNLLSNQKSEEIASLDLERQAEAYEISKNKYEAGLIREVDALQMEVDLAEAQSSSDEAKLSLQSATNSFKELLGLDLSDEIVLKSDLSYRIIAVDPEEAVRLALENRTEIRDYEINQTIQRMNIRQQKAAGMVRANLTAYYQKVGVYTQEPRGDYTSAFRHSFSDFGDRPANFGVGLTITVPILDWGENRALVRAAEAGLKQIEYQKKEQERSIETEVRNLVAKLGSNLKRLQLLEKNVAVAEKSFQITLQRFSDGDIDSQALSLERTRLNNAYRTHLGAYITYQLSIAQLTRDTFYDFTTNELIE